MSAEPSVPDLAAAAVDNRDNGDRPWPVWALSSAEQAADWPDGIVDDRVPADYLAAEGHYDEDAA